MPLHVYLIRHGETSWSLTHQHTGRTDIALTEHGEEEARQLGMYLRKTTFDRVFSSPSLRARKTCELVGASRAPEIEPDLAEWDYGDYEGSCTVNIRKERPDWSIFRDGCPGGESPIQVSTRADRFIAFLRTLEGRIALFSHGQYGCVLGTRWIGIPVAAGPHFMLGTASLCILSFAPDHPTVPVIALWNAFSTDMAGL